jgi:metallo-beta-lactamase family protein
LTQIKSRLILCGFQAQGTLGRLLVDDKQHIKIFNETYNVKAKVETLGGFSAHTGQQELMD